MRAAKDHRKKFQSKLAASFSVTIHSTMMNTTLSISPEYDDARGEFVTSDSALKR